MVIFPVSGDNSCSKVKHLSKFLNNSFTRAAEHLYTISKMRNHKRIHNTGQYRSWQGVLGMWNSDENPEASVSDVLCVGTQGRHYSFEVAVAPSM